MKRKAKDGNPGTAVRHLRRGGMIPGKRLGGYRSGTAYSAGGPSFPMRHKGRGMRRSKRRSRR